MKKWSLKPNPAFPLERKHVSAFPVAYRLYTGRTRYGRQGEIVDK
jgi:hypothetical protein